MPLKTVATLDVQRLEILSPDGTVDEKLMPKVSNDLLLKMYRLMFQIRAFDERAIMLQRQGRLGTYPMITGQEATQCVPPLCLKPTDWAVPTYRGGGVYFARGMQMRYALLYWAGDDRGTHFPDGNKDMMFSIPVGTHLTQVAGLAWGEKFKGKGGVAVTYCGDGTSSKGDLHEALTFAGQFKLPVIYIIENNGWAISVPRKRQAASQTLAQKAWGYGVKGLQVDGNDALAVYAAMSEAVARARKGEGPTLLECETYRMSHHTTADDATRYRDSKEVEAWKKRDPIARFKLFLEKRKLWDAKKEKALAAETVKWIDGEIKAYEETPAPNPLNMFADNYAHAPWSLVEQRMELEELLKFKGGAKILMELPPSEGEVPVSKTMAKPAKKAAAPAAPRTLNLVQAVNEALDLALGADERVMILGEDVGRNGGVFRATDGLWKKYGDDRVVDTPLAEIGIMGSAIGLAVNGMRPVAEIQFDGFMPSVFDQVVCHLGRIRSRSRGQLSVPLVLRAPHGGLIHAPEHHSESPEAYFCHTPGIKVVIPSTPYDAKGLLLAAIEDPDPVVFFEPKLLYRSATGEVPSGHYTVPIGKARLVQEGADLTIITWGAMTVTCQKAAEKLKSEDSASVEILDLRTLSPLDLDAILASVGKTGRCVIAHEAPNTGSWAAELSALIAERGLLKLLAPVQRVGGWDIRMPLFRLEQYYIPDADRVVMAARKALNF